MKKIVIAGLLCICSFFTANANVDTMYYARVTFSCYTSDGRELPPRVVFALFRDLDSYHLDLSSYENLISSLYENAYWSNILFFEYEECLWRLGVFEYEEFEMSELYDTCGKCLDSFISTDSISINDTTSVYVGILKMIADFQKTDIEHRSTNSLNIKYDIEMYKYDYFYQPCKIIECLPIRREELNKVVRRSRITDEIEKH